MVHFDPISIMLVRVVLGLFFAVPPHTHPNGVEIWWQACESFDEVLFGDWLIDGVFIVMLSPCR
jgi:hypothetical protein